MDEILKEVFDEIGDDVLFNMHHILNKVQRKTKEQVTMSVFNKFLNDYLLNSNE